MIRLSARRCASIRAAFAYGPGHEEPRVLDVKRGIISRLPPSWGFVDTDLGEFADDVDVAIVNSVAADVLERWPSLRLVANMGVGVDGVITAVPAHVPLTRVVDEGVRQRFALWTLTACLNVARGTFRFVEAQRRCIWDVDVVQRDPRDIAVLVLGQGGCGTAALELLKTTGFVKARGWRRDANLDDLLHKSDIVINALPSTPQLRNFVDANFLAKLPRGAAFVSAGRGEVIDETALLAALNDGRLSEAILDVFVEEPLPQSSPLWSHPRVVVTPHVAAWASPAVIADGIAANWARLQSNQPLIGLVDRLRGY